MSVVDDEDGDDALDSLADQMSENMRQLRTTFASSEYRL